LLKEKIDYILVNNRFYLHSLFGVVFAFKNNIPVVLIEHASGHFSVNNWFLDFFGHLYEHIITILVKKYCSAFCGVSPQCNKWLEHYHILAKNTFPNSVDILEIERIKKNSTKNYRKEYNISNDEIIVCYTGRLIKEKGIQKLIDAIDFLNKSIDNSKQFMGGGGILYKRRKYFLFIAGSGTIENYVKKRLNENIFFLGQLNFEEIIALLKDSDMFCLPTDYSEGFPTSILEAVACDCFCISTIKSGSQQLFPDKNFGILIDKNTVEQLSDAIKYVANNKEYQNNAVFLAKNELMKNFIWEKTAQKILNFFEDWR
jgi:glycosyltransferase involved in cell wall biosynthesis